MAGVYCHETLALIIFTSAILIVIVVVVLVQASEIDIFEQHGDLPDGADGVVQLQPGLRRHHVLLHQELKRRINLLPIETVPGKQVIFMESKEGFKPTTSLLGGVWSFRSFSEHF